MAFELKAFEHYDDYYFRMKRFTLFTYVHQAA